MKLFKCRKCKIFRHLYSSILRGFSIVLNQSFMLKAAMPEHSIDANHNLIIDALKLKMPAHFAICGHLLAVLAQL